MIEPELAEEGAALISKAIGELMEDASADAVRMQKGAWKVVVVKADRFKAVGADVASLQKPWRS
jgi:hypothetical protein